MAKFNPKQTPHPLVEDHYHIQELIENQERRHDDRVAHRERGKARAERDDLIRDAKPFTVMDFWCNQCRKDFKGEAVKQVEADWNADQNLAFYKTKCFRGHWCIRLITDRNRDAYFQRSRSVARDRGAFHNDIIQPFETNYNLLYGKK